MELAPGYGYTEEPKTEMSHSVFETPVIIIFFIIDLIRKTRKVYIYPRFYPIRTRKLTRNSTRKRKKNSPSQNLKMNPFINANGKLVYNFTSNFNFIFYVEPPNPHLLSLYSFIFKYNICIFF